MSLKRIGRRSTEEYRGTIHGVPADVRHLINSSGDRVIIIREIERRSERDARETSDIALRTVMSLFIIAVGAVLFVAGAVLLFYYPALAAGLACGLIAALLIWNLLQLCGLV